MICRGSHYQSKIPRVLRELKAMLTQKFEVWWGKQSIVREVEEATV